MICFFPSFFNIIKMISLVCKKIDVVFNSFNLNDIRDNISILERCLKHAKLMIFFLCLKNEIAGCSQAARERDDKDVFYRITLVKTGAWPLATVT